MKKTTLLLVFFTLISCKNNTGENESLETNTVKIGGLEWISSNLNTNKFQNGDEIYEAKNSEDWINAGNEERPAWCYYKFDSSNEKLYGKLYNWYAANDSRGLAPMGWHVATNGEWKELSNINGEYHNKKSSSMYLDEIKFNPISSGFCSFKGKFIDIDDDYCQWWCFYNKKQRKSFAWGVSSKKYTSWKVEDKRVGLPVRCVKDK